MRTLRPVRPKCRGGKQNGTADLALVRRLLQGRENAGRGQIPIVRLRRLGGEVPERDGNLFAERIERGDQAL
jgi:hypothetical protein